MFCKGVLVFVQIALIQQAISQAINRFPYNNGIPGPYCGVGSTGGGFPVTSYSPFNPVGITVYSENSYEGTLTVNGHLPFLGTVGLEGILPSTGAGSISYGCGNGDVGMVTEGPMATGIVGSVGQYAPGVATQFAPGQVAPFASGVSGPFAPGSGLFYPGSVTSFSPGYGPFAPGLAPSLAQTYPTGCNAS